jgi:spore coat protein JB
MNKEQALKRVSMYQFAMHEANLFLDTHPDCTEAIKAFNKYRRLYKEAIEDFAENYGPLEVSQTSDETDYFDWVKGPWPWEVQN